MIGLSGGIGAGKSTVAQVWRECGAYIVDADDISRGVVAPGSEGLARVAEVFGVDLIDEKGALRRAELARRAFIDDEHTELLNSLLWPLISAEADRQISLAPDPALAVYDVPLLIEHNLMHKFSHIVMVMSSPENRLQRLQEIRGMSAADAAARMAQQASDDERLAVADIVIPNDGSLEELQERAIETWDYLRRELSI